MWIYLSDLQLLLFMEPIKVDLNSLNDEQKRADRVVRAHDEEVTNLKLV